MSLLAAFVLGHALAANPATDARALYEEGNVEYKLGHFEKAAALYEQAYAKKKLPGFLFNIAQCKLALEDFDGAVHFYEGYLRESPSAPNRSLVEDLIRESRSKANVARELKEKADTARRLALEKEAAAAEEKRLAEERKLVAEEKNREAARLEGARKVAVAEADKERARADAEQAKADAVPGWVIPVVGGSAAGAVVLSVVGMAAAGVIYYLSLPAPDSLGTHDLAAGAR